MFFKIIAGVSQEMVSKTRGFEGHLRRQVAGDFGKYDIKVM